MEDAEQREQVIVDEVSATFRHSGPECVEIEITGELDGPGLERLRTVMPPTADRGVVVDLSGVTFMGSSGISWLIGLHRQAGQLVVRRPSPIVLRVLEVTGVAEMLAIVGRVEPDEAIGWS